MFQKIVFCLVSMFVFFSCENSKKYNDTNENKRFECDYVYEKCFEVDGYSVYSIVQRGCRTKNFVAIPVVQEKTSSCSACGNDVYKTDMFCSSCGKPLRGL